MADVEDLLALPGVDREEVAGYFAEYGLRESYRQIEEALRTRGL